MSWEGMRRFRGFREMTAIHRQSGPQESPRRKPSSALYWQAPLTAERLAPPTTRMGPQSFRNVPVEAHALA